MANGQKPQFASYAGENPTLGLKRGAPLGALPQAFRERQVNLQALAAARPERIRPGLLDSVTYTGKPISTVPGEARGTLKAPKQPKTPRKPKAPKRG